jgi:hypothetical protein
LSLVVAVAAEMPLVAAVQVACMPKQVSLSLHFDQRL